MFTQIPVQRHSRVNLGSSKAAPRELQNKNILPSLSFTKPASMPPSPTSSLTARYQESLDTQTKDDRPSIVMFSTEPVYIDPEPGSILDATRILHASETDKTIDYGTIEELTGDAIISQLELVTLDTTDIVRSPRTLVCNNSGITEFFSPSIPTLTKIRTDNINIPTVSLPSLQLQSSDMIEIPSYPGLPHPLLQLQSSDIVEVLPSPSSEPSPLVSFMESLSKRKDIPVHIRTIIQSELLNYTSSNTEPKKTAFGTFSAIVALVRLQRRTRKRYQTQQDDLINALGL